MRMTIPVLMILGLLAATGCQTTSDSGAPAATSGAQPAAAPQAFRGSYTSHDRVFALPPGEWRLVKTRTDTTNSDHAAPETFSVLVSVTGQVIDRVAVVYVQRKYRYQDRWSQYKGCLTTENPRVYSAEVRENTGDRYNFTSNTRVDCWHVRSFSMGLKGDAHWTVEALNAYAKANGLYLAPTMVGARFAQKPLYDRRDYVEFLWNADLLLGAPDGKPWPPEAFLRETVKSDPAKTAVMEGVKAWAADWRARYPIASPERPTS